MKKLIKKIDSTKNYYISNFGEVYSQQKDGTMRQMKTAKNSSGYEYVGLNDNKFHFIAELVFETFMGKIPEGMQINHKNSVKDDNRLSNIQLCTRSENCQLKEPSLIPSFTIKNNGKYYMTFTMFGGDKIYGTYDDIDSMLKDFEVLRNTKIKQQSQLIKKIDKRTKELYN